MSESYKTLPTVIEGTTGHSTKYATQVLSNPTNLTSTDTNLAFWGVQKPKYLGNPLRDWPDAISSKNGSFYTPEKIIAKGFQKPTSISDKGKINSIKIIYKYGQISYSSKTAYGSFKQPTIELVNNNTTLSSIKGHIPPEDGIYNISGQNVNKRNLTNTYTESFDISSKELTIGDIPNLSINFANTNNTSTNHCRIVMQYIQLEIEYEDTPEFRTSIAYDGDREREVGSTVDAWVQVMGQNSISDHTICEIVIPKGLKLDEKDINLQYGSLKQDDNKYDKTYRDGNLVLTWYVNKFNTLTTGNDIKGNIYKTLTAKMFLKLTAVDTGEQKISSEIKEFFGMSYRTDSRSFLIYRVSNSEILTLDIDNNLINVNEESTITTIYTTNTTAQGTIHINTGGLTVNWFTFVDGNKVPVTLNTETNGYYYQFDTSIKQVYKYIGEIVTSTPNNYTITAYKNTNLLTKTQNLTIVPKTFSRENFELAVEDGTAVEYNHIIFTKGDDLSKPLIYKEYELSDNPVNDLTITGINKHIPLNQTQYVTFKVSMDIADKKTYNNLLFGLNITSKESGKDDKQILVGCSPDIEIIDSKYVVLDSISTGEVKEIKIAVQSLTQKTDDIVLSLYGKTTREVTVKNEIAVPENPTDSTEITDGKYTENVDDYTTTIEQFSTPATVLFKDLPSLKLKIDNELNIHEFTHDINQYEEIIYPSFDLIYTVENVSNITADMVNLKIIEPEFFYTDNTKSSQEYDKSTNIWQIKNLQPNEIKRLVITYTPYKKGNYDFIIQTLDSELTTIDDIYQNEYRYNVLVDIEPETVITDIVSNNTPTVKELIEYTVKVKNDIKTRKNLVINIDDIGAYDTQHSDNHYIIENIDCEYGTFTKGTGKNIGYWSIDNLGIDKEYYLNLTLRPISIGSHDINISSNEINYTKTNIVNVLKEKGKISFDVYQGIDLREDKTTDIKCNEYTRFCDNDFICTDDEYGYVITVSNDSKNDTNDIGNIYIDAILPKELGDYIINDKYNLQRNADNRNILTFKIGKLEKCQSTTFCFGIKPKIKGEFSALFVLYGDNLNVTTKTLKVTVSDTFPEYQLEHYLNIYNFERLNKYYTYQLTADGTDLKKVFHKGDKSIRMIERTPYNKKAIETFKGSNLKSLCRKLEESRYVKPTFLRQGTNQLDNSLYELYPDGFIRRFGLLQSEIYHNTGVLPTTSDIIDSVMKWDIDKWDTRLWGGDIWDTGVFRVTIDYSKMPSNFNYISINQLQNIVNKTKPFGMKGIAYYSDTERFDLKMNMSKINTTGIISPVINIPNIDLRTVTKYSHSDGRLSIHDRSVDFDIKNAILKLNKSLYKGLDKTSSIIKPNINVKSYYLQQQYSQSYINDYNDIFDSNNLSKFDIYKKIDIIENSEAKYIINKRNFKLDDASNDINSTTKSELIKSEFLTDSYQLLYSFNNDVINNTEFGIYLQDEENKYLLRACRYKNTINGKDGFKLILNDEIINDTNISTKVYNFKILVQRSANKYLHFFYVLNNEKIAHHFGFYKDYNKINYQGVYTLKYQNTDSRDYTFDKISLVNDSELNFKLSDNYSIVSKGIDSCIQINDDLVWDKINNIYDKNSFTTIKYESNKDKDCIKGNVKKYTSPIIATFDNIDIDDIAEVKDIGIKIKAESNKNNFINDIDANILLNGSSYIPNNKESNKIIYPSLVNNIEKEYFPIINIEEDNVSYCNNCGTKFNGIESICSVCKSTNISLLLSKYTTCHSCGLSSKGYYKKCPNCNSYDVTYDNIKQVSTYCNNCKELMNGYYKTCPFCNSSDVEITSSNSNATLCNTCGRITGGYHDRCQYCNSQNVTNIDSINQQQYNSKLYDSTKKYDFTPIHFTTDMTKVQLCDLEINMNNKTKDIDKLSSLPIHIVGTNNKNYKFFACETCGNIGIGNKTTCPYCYSDLVDNYGLGLINISGYVIYQGVIQTLKIDNPNIEYGDFDVSFDILNLIKKNNYDSFTIRLFINNDYNNTLLKQINDLEILDDDKIALINNIDNIDIDIMDINNKAQFINTNNWNYIDGLLDKTKQPIEFTVKEDMKSTDSINISGFDFKNIYSFKNATLHINGVNYSDNNIVLYLKTISNTKINDYQLISTNINSNIFNIEYNLLNILDENEFDKDLEILFYFDNMDSLSTIKLFDIYIDVEYNKGLLSLPTIKNNTYTKLQDGIDYLLLSDNLWGLVDNIPKQINGYNINNRILAVIDFNQLSFNEYIKLYNIGLVVKYINNKGTFNTAYIENYDPENSKIKIVESIDNEGAEFFGKLAEDSIMINNDIALSKDSNGEYLNDIKLYKNLYQSFKPTSSSITSIELNTLDRVGYPNEKIKLCIYDSKNNKPDNLLGYSYIDGWISKSNSLIKYDLFIDNLDINQTYWIGLELEDYNKYNYYTLKFNNSNIGTLLRKDIGNQFEDISNLTLSFNIYEPIYRYLYNNTPVLTDGDYGFRVENTILRQNTESNVILSNLNVARGKDYSKNYKTEVVVENIESQAGQNINLIAYIKNQDNSSLNGGSVTFYIQGVEVGTVNTFDGNKATLNYQLNSSFLVRYNYNIEAIYTPPSPYKQSKGNGVLTITSFKKPNIKLIVNDILTYTEDINMQIFVKDDDNTIITDGRLDVKILDTKYNTNTKYQFNQNIPIHSSGCTTVTVNSKDINLMPSTNRYKILIYYIPTVENIYSESSVLGQILTINKKNTSLTVNNNQSFVVFSGEHLITKLFEENTQNTIKSQRISINYNKNNDPHTERGVIINDGKIDDTSSTPDADKTNDGKYELGLYLSYGTWNFEIIFDGNEYYNYCKANVSLTTLQAPAFLNKDEGSMIVKLSSDIEDKSRLEGQNVIMYNPTTNEVIGEVKTVVSNNVGVADFTSYKTDGTTAVKYKLDKDDDFYILNELDGYR